MVEDVRDICKKTAIITTPLPDVMLEGTNSIDIMLETSPKATVTAESGSSSIATAAVSGNKLTITGVAAGTTLVNLTISADGEATSYRSISVEVVSAS